MPNFTFLDNIERETFYVKLPHYSEANYFCVFHSGESWRISRRSAGFGRSLEIPNDSSIHNIDLFVAIGDEHMNGNIIDVKDDINLKGLANWWKDNLCEQKLQGIEHDNYLHKEIGKFINSIRMFGHNKIYNMFVDGLKEIDSKFEPTTTWQDVCYVPQCETVLFKVVLGNPEYCEYADYSQFDEVPPQYLTFYSTGVETSNGSINFDNIELVNCSKDTKIKSIHWTKII